ncbi:MAG: DUF362 domain-containing protein [Candidatus Omnitrophica bacterium]|jgi:uncharacterized protein (DUF362 family)/ferredoxin|nr:DUF362 domain-containing protein [Candidatus Omnitrophota bacterium]
MTKHKVSIVSCKDYTPELVQEAVNKSVKLLGGIESLIKPKSTVLLKPNVLMSASPESGITTHPEVLRAVIRLLKPLECRIVAGDSPSAWGKYINNVNEVYAQSGITRVCKEEGVELVLFGPKRFYNNIPLTAWIGDCDYIINIPKFKTHGMMLMTAAVKNLFGLVCGSFKTELHKKYFRPSDFAAMLLDIYKSANPVINIVDGIVAMEGDGPATSGKLRQEKIIVAGSDALAVDYILALIMGIDPLSVPVNKEAKRIGMLDFVKSDIQVLGEPLEKVIGRKFLLPKTAMSQKLPEPVARFIMSFIKYRPYIDASKCIQCFACIKACPKQVIIFENTKMCFDYKKCIACFCCQEVCPKAAVKVKKSLLARLIGL